MQPDVNEWICVEKKAAIDSVAIAKKQIVKQYARHITILLVFSYNALHMFVMSVEIEENASWIERITSLSRQMRLLEEDTLKHAANHI